MDKKRIYEIIDLLACESELFFNFLKTRKIIDFDKFKKEESFLVSFLEIKYNIRITSGKCKMVIILNNEDYVIKIPFSSCGKDYCKLEYENWCAALKEGMNIFFSPCEKILPHPISFLEGGATKIIKIPLYLMRKAKVDEEFIEDLATSNWEERSSYEELSDDDFEILQIFSRYYNENEINKLIDFISEHNINDLHCANIGLREDKCPVIIDYSGY